MSSPPPNEEELKIVLGELARRQEQEKIRFFVPNGKQEEFISKVGEGKHFVLILSAGNGIGKTAVVMNILGNIIWGPQNEWFRKPLFENWPFPKRGRIVTESKNVEAIGAIEQEIESWWPKGRFSASKSGKLYNSLYHTDTGWILDKMSYEQEPKEFESSTIGLGIFDEPPPKQIFDAMISRMRKGGIIIISMTPLEGADWIFEEGGLLDSEDCFILYADMEDNCREHGVRGVLEHQHIDKILSKLTPGEREARKCGKPLSAVHTIFGSSWSPEVHIIEDDVKPPMGSQFGMTVDPADGKPYAVAWWWVDPRGHIVFDYNWPEENWVKLMRNKPILPIMEEYGQLFKRYEGTREMEWRIMDRHFGANRNVRTGKTLIEDWEQWGYSFQPSYHTDNEVPTGILKVQEYLSFDRARPLNGMNLPRVYVKRRCKNIIMSVPKWPRKVDPMKLVSEPDRNSVYKDFCDVVRYTCMLQPEVYISRPAIQRQAGYVLGR